MGLVRKIFRAIVYIISNLQKKLKYRLYLYIKSLLDFGIQIEQYENFHKNGVLHPSVKIFPEAKIDNFSSDACSVSIGENTVIRGQLFVFAHAGKIEIGKDCFVGDNSRIWSADSIKISDRVYISHNVNIHDTNSHSIKPSFRYQHCQTIINRGHPKVNDFDIRSKPICIENDVWIGFNSTILKGVKIGRGVVVAACSVVTKDVPEFVIVAGNPAKIVREISYLKS